jgi:hypothetical protein
MSTSRRLLQLPETQADHERNYIPNRCHRIWKFPTLLPEATGLVSPGLVQGDLLPILPARSPAPSGPRVKLIVRHVFCACRQLNRSSGGWIRPNSCREDHTLAVKEARASCEPSGLASSTRLRLPLPREPLVADNPVFLGHRFHQRTHGCVRSRNAVTGPCLDGNARLDA